MTSYHTHSRWSDGQTSIAAMIAAAEKINLQEFGISDHYVLTPHAETDTSWSMPVERLGEYVDEVLSLSKTSHLTVRLGLEVDYFPENPEEIRNQLSPYPFDYLIGSVHFVDTFPVDHSADFWAPLTQADINRIHVEYWQRVAMAAKSGLFDWLGHLDLVKKFAFRPDIDLSDYINAALDAIVDADIAIELNTSGWDKPCQEAYPDHLILSQCARRNIPVILTADAHSPEELLRHYDRGQNLLNRLGVRQQDRYCRHQASPSS